MIKSLILALSLSSRLRQQNTIEIWFSTSANQNDNMPGSILFHLGTDLSSPSTSFGVKMLTDKSLGMFVYVQGLYTEVSSGLPFSGHVDSHLVLSVDFHGPNINMTLNGQLLCTIFDPNTAASEVLTNPYSIQGYIGRPLADTGTNYPEFVGSVDELRVWAGLVAPVDILKNYGFGPNRFEYTLLHRYSMNTETIVTASSTGGVLYMADTASSATSTSVNGAIAGNIDLSSGRRASFLGLLHLLNCT